MFYLFSRCYCFRIFRHNSVPGRFYCFQIFATTELLKIHSKKHKLKEVFTSCTLWYILKVKLQLIASVPLNINIKIMYFLYIKIQLKTKTLKKDHIN